MPMLRKQVTLPYRRDRGVRLAQTLANQPMDQKIHGNHRHEPGKQGLGMGKLHTWTRLPRGPDAVDEGDHARDGAQSTGRVAATEGSAEARARRAAAANVRPLPRRRRASFPTLPVIPSHHQRRGARGKPRIDGLQDLRPTPRRRQQRASIQASLPSRLLRAIRWRRFRCEHRSHRFQGPDPREVMPC
jgi:hypothetical protein